MAIECVLQPSGKPATIKWITVVGRLDRVLLTVGAAGA